MATTKYATPLALPERTRRNAGLAGYSAAFLLAANMVLALLHPAAMGEHSTGPGRLSEGLVGAAFLAGSCFLGLVLMAGADRLGPGARITCGVCVAAFAGAGATMVAVLVNAVEPPVELFLLTASGSLVGLAATAVIGARARIWTRTTGMLLALQLPVLFLLPLNSLLMAGIWVVMTRQLTSRQRRAGVVATIAP
ncbi:hypothetical protein [Paeniglutamicibacter cryotolerans]|uniref:DUF4386 family protein n=1 Tax=Paeniglutamicibacter cryotolerans TaxID=670079 RepID=A0A839QM11_9MICC|nr:hypothetical protein [Paeniglutamicibacter cryotolerans]MBB2995794.1 hypothetical protein [Paeniglutamicibacter cryotolerans]